MLNLLLRLNKENTVETIHYLQNLPLYQLFWLIATLVIGVSFSLRNYVLYFISIFHG